MIFDITFHFSQASHGEGISMSVDNINVKFCVCVCVGNKMDCAEAFPLTYTKSMILNVKPNHALLSGIKAITVQKMKYQIRE